MSYNLMFVKRFSSTQIHRFSPSNFNKIGKSFYSQQVHQSKGMNPETKNRIWLLGSLILFGPLFYEMTKPKPKESHLKDHPTLKHTHNDTLTHDSNHQTQQKPTSKPELNPIEPIDLNFKMEEPTLEIPIVDYILIGGGTSSYSAMKSIKEIDPNSRILIIGDEPYLPYTRTPLSKELWFGELNDLEYKDWQGNQKSIFYEMGEIDVIKPSELLNDGGHSIKMTMQYKVERLNVNDHTVVLENGQIIKYGKVLVATGGKPKPHPILSNLVDVSKSSTFRTIDDFKALKNLVESGKSVAIIGGGFLGSELACALSQSKKGEVYQVFPEQGNMFAVLPKYLTLWTSRQLTKLGVKVYPNTKVMSAKIQGDQVLLETDVENLLVDHVVSSFGIEPNTQLANDSELEIDEIRGGIVVNAELEARKDVYVAGDVCSYHDILFGRRRVEHYDHAVESGRQAGYNMAGQSKPYSHISMFWSDLGPSIGYEAVGLVDSKLDTVGVWAKGESGRETSSLIDEKEEFNRGVVFYMKQKRIVGILLWNHFGKLELARKIISENKVYEDVNQVATLFNVHQK